MHFLHFTRLPMGAKSKICANWRPGRYNDAIQLENEMVQINWLTDDPTSVKRRFDEVKLILEIFAAHSWALKVNNNETYRRKVLLKFPIWILQHISQADGPSILEMAPKSDPKWNGSVLSQWATCKQSPALVLASNAEAVAKNSWHLKQDQGNEPAKNCRGGHCSSYCVKYKTVKERTESVPLHSPVNRQFKIICVVVLHLRHRPWRRIPLLGG